MDKKKKVLIVGNSAKEYALVKKFKNYDCDIFVLSGNSAISELAECVDIREENVQEILEYVLENAIDLTIVTSEVAIKNNIAELFQTNNQLIFCPTAQSAQFTLSRSAGKRFLYKLRIPTPRFGIFDKLPLAIDYLKNAPMPQVIRADENSNSADRLVCTTFAASKTFVEDLFNKDENKVVLEDYVYGHEFTIYVVTDGYSALHLATVANYKFAEDGDGGILTSGVGAYTPDYKISSDIENSVMQNVVERVLASLQRKETPYLGVLGIDCVLTTDENFVTLDFKPFLSDHDAEAVLNLVDENLLTLFEACAVGSFADDYEKIDVSDNSSVSCVISSRKKGEIIKGLELVESDITHFATTKNKYFEYETVEGKTLVLTKTAKTLSRARKHLYEDVELISFSGKKCRNDICEKVEKF
jgi:phosphoribosylamine---glycine ligase